MYELNPIVDSRGSVTLQNVVDTLGWEELKNSPYAHEIRRLLQVSGGTAGRKILGLNVWINIAMNKMEPGIKYVISDCRYTNECRAIEDRGGMVWRIERPGIEKMSHASEQLQYDYHTVIHNDGSLDDLTDKVVYAYGNG